MAFISVSTAKDHLRITTESENTDIDLKIQQAEAIVLERCNVTETMRTTTATWTAATVPRPVQAAILLVLTHLHEHRGDDMETDAALQAAVDRVLGPHREPVIA